MYTGSSLQVQTYPGSSWNQGQGGQPAWGKVALVKKEPGILAAPQTEVRELICDELDVATIPLKGGANLRQHFLNSFLQLFHERLLYRIAIMEYEWGEYSISQTIRQVNNFNTG